MPLALQDADLLRDRGLVDGAWIEADAGRRFDVLDPASGEVVGTAPRMGIAETRRAIAAAEAAQPAWRARTARDRARILRRFADLMAAVQLSAIDYLGDVPWDDHEVAKDWYARLKSRPSFRSLLADNLPGAPPPPHYADLDF